MKKILVSGASGIVGYGILRSLKKSDAELLLIGITMYNDSAAEFFCDIFEQALPTNHPGYMEWLISIINKHQIDMIIPGIEVDLYTWIEHRADIEQAGAKVLLNNPALISLCQDKWVFYQALSRFNTPYAIESTLNNDYATLVEQFGLPFLLKPRCGFGGKGIVKVNCDEDFLPHQDNVGAVLMAQPLVGNDNEEYTTSAFCDGQGGYYARMTLKRKLSESGFTEKAEVVFLPAIDAALVELCNYFKPLGPTNFQFRLHQGVLKLLEINPRMSSSSSIRTAFGYNESLMTVDYFLDNKIPVQPLIKKGRAVRYTEDYIVYEDRADI